MAITISGENNNDKIIASDGVIDSLSTLTTNLIGDVTGNLTGNVTGNINNTTLLLQTGGYERIRITPTGDVAINRTAALNTSKFSLTKDPDQQGIGVQLNQSSGITTSLTAYNSAGNNIFDLAHDTDNTPDLLFKLKHSSDGAPVEKVRITSSGDVGIGTNPSTYSLHVLGGGSAVARFEREGGEAWAKVDIKAGTSAGNSYITFSDPDNSEVAAINYEHSNDTFRIETWNGTSKVHRIGITTNGNVGINDASPERTLDVVGNNAMIQIEGSGGSGKQWSLCSADNTTGAAVGTAGMFAIYNDTDGVAALRVSNSNYVLRPKLPYFYAYATPTAATSHIHSFGNLNQSSDNPYDNSNGRFTAPVSGFYWFTAGIWCNSNDNTTSVLIQLRKYHSSNSSESSFAGCNHTTKYNNLNVSGGVYLEQNDYVYIHHQGGMTIQASTPRNFFSGYLVG